MGRQFSQKIGIRRHTRNLYFAQRNTQLTQRLSTVRAMYNDLGNHRIVPRRNLCPRFDTIIHTRSTRHLKMGNHTRCRQEPRRHILGIKSCFKTMAVDPQFILAKWQRATRSNSQLPRHQIHARNRLCHRMLYLQPRIHLHEPKPIWVQPLRAIHNKLDCACPRIANRLGSFHRSVTHRFTHLGSHVRRWRFFNHLLMTTLERTIPLEQMHRIHTITKHLHLNMARAGDVFLNQHVSIAKSGFRLRLGRGKRLFKRFRLLSQPHSLTAAASYRLDQNRIANLGRLRLQMRGLLIGPLIARHNWYARRCHQFLCRVL